MLEIHFAGDGSFSAFVTTPNHPFTDRDHCLWFLGTYQIKMLGIVCLHETNLGGLWGAEMTPDKKRLTMTGGMPHHLKAVLEKS